MRCSTSDQESSSRTCPSPASGLVATAAAEEVRTTRFTVPALTHDLMTFRVPRTAASTSSFCHRAIEQQVMNRTAFD